MKKKGEIDKIDFKEKDLQENIISRIDVFTSNDDKEGYNQMAML